jgi:DNA gyrase subunit A
MLKAFIAFREEVVSAPHQIPAGTRRATAPISLVGLAIAVANIDEIIKLIRNAPDPERRASVDGARLAGGDVAPLIKLIDDPRHRINEDGNLQSVGRAGARHPRAAAVAPDGARPRRDREDELNEIGAEIKDFSTSWARAPASRRSSAN